MVSHEMEELDSDWFVRAGMENRFKTGIEDVVYEWIKPLEPQKNGRDMHLAGQYGMMSVVELLITKGSNQFNRGLIGACNSGHRAIIDLMIKNGANDWNLGMRCACLNGHRAIVDLMIDHGTDEWDDHVENNHTPLFTK